MATRLKNREALHICVSVREEMLVTAEEYTCQKPVSVTGHSAHTNIYDQRY